MTKGEVEEEEEQTAFTDYDGRPEQCPTGWVGHRSPWP